MQHLILIGVLLGAGCTAQYAQAPLTPDHPAHPAAPTVPVALAPDRLAPQPFARGMPTAPAEEDAHAHHAMAEADRPQMPAPDPLIRILEAYENMGVKLAADATAGIVPQTRHLTEALDRLTQAPPPGQPHFWHQHAEMVQALRTATEQVAAARDLQSTRVAFGHLSEALIGLMEQTGVPDALQGQVHQLTCGMFTEAPRGGVWLQVGSAIPRNPYFGTAMLGCVHDNRPLGAAPDAAPQEPAQPEDHKKHTPSPLDGGR